MQNYQTLGTGTRFYEINKVEIFDKENFKKYTVSYDVALNRLEVLTVDATVIIGLLVLLTFQSISSSFIENESSLFMQKWYDAQNELRAADSFLDDCKILNENLNEYEKIFLNEHSRIADDGTHYTIFDHLSKEVEVEIKKKCNETTIETMEILWKARVIEEWGYDFNYLQQSDELGNIFRASDGHLYDPNLFTSESDYLHDIITGPMWVNMINLGMLFPFLISAAVACVNIIRYPNDDNSSASRLAIITMGIGFVLMILGLFVIVIGFLTVYTPFITT